MRVYVGCNCRMCRLMGGGKDGESRNRKLRAHRAYRRKWRQSMRVGDEGPVSISTGYIA